MNVTVPPPVNEQELQALIHRLKRLEGQARGVQRMLEEGRDCREVLMQLSAMKAAINRIAMLIVASNMEHCISTKEGEDKEIQMKELAKALANF